MITQWKTLVATVVFALAIGSVGCGGGGGGGGDFDGALPDVPTDPLAITSANALDVASSSMGIMSFLSFISSDVMFPALPSGVNEVSLSNMPVGLTRLVGSRLKSIPTVLPAAETTATVAVVITMPPQACIVGGTYTLTMDVTDPNNPFLPGDVLAFSYNSCNDGEGVILSGTFTLTIQAVSGDLSNGPYDMTALLTYGDLSITQSGETLVVDGNATLRERTQDNILIFSTLSASGPLSIVQPGVDAATLSAFVQDETYNEGVVPMAYTVNSSGTLAEVALNGSVQYETTVTFEGNLGTFPYTGEMLVTGAAGSNETIIALDSVNLRIEVDENGDGAVDRIIDTTWEAM